MFHRHLVTFRLGHQNINVFESILSSVRNFDINQSWFDCDVMGTLFVGLLELGRWISEKCGRNQKISEA